MKACMSQNIKQIWVFSFANCLHYFEILKLQQLTAWLDTSLHLLLLKSCMFLNDLEYKFCKSASRLPKKLASLMWWKIYMYENRSSAVIHFSRKLCKIYFLYLISPPFLRRSKFKHCLGPGFFLSQLEDYMSETCILLAEVKAIMVWEGIAKHIKMFKSTFRKKEK